MRPVRPSEDDAPQRLYYREMTKSSDQSPHCTMTVCHLYAFSTNEDPSDNDSDVRERAVLDMGSPFTVAWDDAAVKRKLERAKRTSVFVSFSLSPGPGCEHDALWPLRKYQIYHVRVGGPSRKQKWCLCSSDFASRSACPNCMKTSRSTASSSSCQPRRQIVVETTDNYLIVGHYSTCKVIPKDKVHPELWVAKGRCEPQMARCTHVQCRLA